MTDLWFTAPTGEPRRRGAMVYATRPGRVWAVVTTARVFPDDATAESAELTAFYGASVSTLGHLLLGAGVRLPADLVEWATAPDRPMADLGGWTPLVCLIDDLAQLGLARRFGRQRAVVSTVGNRHLTLLAPADFALRLHSPGPGELPRPEL